MGIYDPGTRLHLVVSCDNKSVDLNGIYQPLMMTRVSPVFAFDGPSGRVDLVRHGNTVRAVTRSLVQVAALARRVRFFEAGDGDC
jgi:hypothetical protein